MTTVPGRTCNCGMPMIVRRKMIYVCRNCDLLGLISIGPAAEGNRRAHG